MLPYPQDLMKMAGLDPAKVFASVQGDGRRVDAKTVRNWFEGKTVPRGSAVQRFFENVVARFVGAKGAKAEALQLVEAANNASEWEGNPYFLAWEQFFSGWKLAAHSRMWLDVEEAKRLVELTRSAQVYVKDRDRRGLSQFLAQSDFPKTKITLNAIEVLRQSNQNISDELLKKTLVPIILTNVLYLIACADTKNELLLRLCPLLHGEDIQLPMSRWLDAIKQGKSFSSDKELGSFLLPNYDPDNAKREVMHWRKGVLPSWKTVLKFPYEDEVTFFIAFASIRILHGIYDELTGANCADVGIDCRSLFEEVPKLQKLACERQKLFGEQVL